MVMWHRLMCRLRLVAFSHHPNFGEWCPTAESSTRTDRPYCHALVVYQDRCQEYFHLSRHRSAIHMGSDDGFSDRGARDIGARRCSPPHERPDRVGAVLADRRFSNASVRPLDVGAMENDVPIVDDLAVKPNGPLDGCLFQRARHRRRPALQFATGKNNRKNQENPYFYTIYMHVFLFYKNDDEGTAPRRCDASGCSPEPVQYWSAEMISPPALLPRAHHVWGATLCLMNLTEPSANATLAPPGWRLKGP
jgi:hypothetical protein